MKRTGFVLSLVMVLVLMVGVVGTVAAQGPDGRPDRGRGPAIDTDTEAALADYFGISVQELRAYFDEGLTPLQLAEQLGITPTPLETFFLERLPVTRLNLARVERQTELATALGITVEELQAYLDQYYTLPEIADELGVDLSTIDWPLRGAFMDQDDVHAMIAEALGISADELQAYFDEGYTLSEVAEELGVDLSELDLPMPFGPHGNFGPRGEGGPGAGEGPRGEGPVGGPGAGPRR